MNFALPYFPNFLFQKGQYSYKVKFPNNSVSSDKPFDTSTTENLKKIKYKYYCGHVIKLFRDSCLC
jgi:hypothetical protein